MRRIRKHYLSTSFPLDIVASFPLDLIVLMAESDTSRMDFSLMGWLRVLKLLRQGLTLVHFSAQRKHKLWDTFGAWLSTSLLDRGPRVGDQKA
jgi:hypothetical protein